MVGAQLLGPRAFDAVLVTAVETVDDPALAAAMLSGRPRSTERAGLLVIADGAARSRRPDAPGAGRPAAPFDDAVAEALAAGDPAALARRLRRPGPGSRPPWPAVDPLLGAGRTHRRPTPGCRRAAVLPAAPLGVGYLVASWRWTAMTGAGTGPPYPRTGHADRGCRPDRHRQIGPGPGPGRAAERRGGQRRLDAAVPGDGHRHREAPSRPAPRRAASSARRPRRDPDARPSRPISAMPAPPSRTSWPGVRTPLLVGGSGLYIRAVVDAIEFPATDPAVRARLEEDLGRVGVELAVRLLADLDPPGRGDDRPGERPQDRPRAGGHRADRPPVQRDHAPLRRSRVRRACSSCSTAPTTSWTPTGASGSAAMVDAGLLDEVRTLDGAGSAPGGDRVPGARLRPVPRRARRPPVTSSRPSSRPPRPPGGSSGGSGPGSVATIG